MTTPGDRIKAIEEELGMKVRTRSTARGLVVYTQDYDELGYPEEEVHAVLGAPEPKPEPVRPVCAGCGGSIYIPEWHTNCEAIYTPEEPVNCESCGRRIRISDYPAFNWADRALADSDYEEARAAKRCRGCKNVKEPK